MNLGLFSLYSLYTHSLDCARLEFLCFHTFSWSAKQSVFFRIQVRANSQTRGLEWGWKRRPRLGRDAKNTDRPFCIRYIFVRIIRFFQPRQFLLAKWSCKLLTSCQVMFPTSHSPCYPGYQRVFMRGFRFRSSLKKWPLYWYLILWKNFIYKL